MIARAYKGIWIKKRLPFPGKPFSTDSDEAIIKTQPERLMTHNTVVNG